MASARAYWTDLSLRTQDALAAAHDYLSRSEQAQCPESRWERDAIATSRFSDVQVSDPHVTLDRGSVRVTVTYLVVGFMDRDPDLPTATYTTLWQWDGSRWCIVSPIMCAAPAT